MARKFDAILSNWSFRQDSHGGFMRLYGTVSSDHAGRFENGELIITSEVQSISSTDGFRIGLTKSGTRYLLVG